ncbi:MAG: hypothetical protein AAF125_13355 [Chloroflexota bacterium]
MPHTIEWQIPDRLLLIQVYGHMTTDEPELITDTAFAMVTTAKHTVHAIVDLKHLEHFPMSLNLITTKRTQNRHPNQGLTLLVHPNINPVLRYVMETIFRAGRWEYAIVRSVDEAMALLNKRDKHIPTVDEGASV